MTLRSKDGIAYEERGAGVTFVALHGYSLDRRMSIGAFEPLFEARTKKGGTSQGYRRIYADLPFMGESTNAPEGEGHDGMLAAMATFVREVAPEGPIFLAGQSYGGYLARGLTRELGERVRGLFFLCPSVVAIRACRDLPRREVRGEETAWREAAKNAGATEADIADYEEHAVTRSLKAFERTREEIIAAIRIARLAELERYPHASYHVLDGAGHNAQIEAPEVFAAAFKAWLADCEAINLPSS